MRDGGPAFPLDTHSEAPGTTYLGMSLRDWFAGQALSAMAIESDRQYSGEDHKVGYPERHAALYAKTAYRIADAMLDALTAAATTARTKDV